MGRYSELAGRPVRRAGRGTTWAAGARRRLRAGRSHRPARGPVRRRQRLRGRPVRAVRGRPCASGCPGSRSTRQRQRHCPSPTTRSTCAWPSWSCTSWQTRWRACANWPGSPCRAASVGASVWDHTTGTGPLSPFWGAARDVDPSAPGEADLAGSREGHLAELAESAGLGEVTSTSLTVRVGLRDLRGLVGALPARGRHDRRLHGDAGRGAPAGDRAALPRGAAGGALRAAGAGVGGAGPRVTVSRPAPAAPAPTRAR